MDKLQPVAKAHTAFAPPEVDLPMTPVQALTSGFDPPLVDTNNAGEVCTTSCAIQGNAPSPATLIELRQGLRVGNLHLMIHYEDGSELTDLPSVYRLPNAPSWFHGMANLHGTLIPVFGLAEYLGLDEYAGLRGPGGSRRMMLVMGSGAEAAGLLIDGLPQRLRFQGEQGIEGAPVPERLEGCITGTYWIDEQPWMDFTPKNLLDRLEAELKPN